MHASTCYKTSCHRCRVVVTTYARAHSPACVQPRSGSRFSTSALTHLHWTWQRTVSPFKFAVVLTTDDVSWVCAWIWESSWPDQLVSKSLLSFPLQSRVIACTPRAFMTRHSIRVVIYIMFYIRISIRGPPSFPKGTLMTFCIFLVNGLPSSKGVLATSPFRRLAGMRFVGG